MIGAILMSFVFFLALMGGLEFGRWLWNWRGVKGDPAAGATAADGVVFAVLGLLIAFTFTSSASRFDERRKLIVDQANALGTAWLRTDLLPPADRTPIRVEMKEWTRLSLEIIVHLQDGETSSRQAWLQTSQKHQNEAWRLAIDAVQRHPRPQYAGFVLSPMNDWIDLTTTRLEMANRGLPSLVMPTLVILSMVCSVVAGFNMGKHSSRSLLHMLAFSGAIAFSVYVIIDLNNPRSGFIRIDAADAAMKQLYASMNDPVANDAVPTTSPTADR